MKVDQSVINNLNKRNVLNCIRSNGPISKAEVSRSTGLSLPTVMKIIDDLILQNLVLDCGTGNSTGGKPPKLVDFNYQSGYIIGVDINDYCIDTILMDLSAKVAGEHIIDIDANISPEFLIEKVIRSISSVIGTNGNLSKQILGICIGLNGTVDRKAGRLVYSPYFKWSDIDFRSPVEEAFGLRVFLHNRTRCMAMGEKMVGNAKGIKNYIFINYGHALDAAVIIDENLYYGANSFAGSIGNMRFFTNYQENPDAPSYSLNELISPDALVKQSKKAIADFSEDQHSLILDLVYGQENLITIYTIIEAAGLGDKLACSLLKNAARFMCHAIENLVCMADPDLFIVDGILPRRSKVFMDELDWRLSNLTSDFPMQNSLTYSEMDKHVGSIGAASIVLNKFMKNGGQLLS